MRGEKVTCLVRRVVKRTLSRGNTELCSEGENLRAYVCRDGAMVMRKPGKNSAKVWDCGIRNFGQVSSYVQYIGCDCLRKNMNTSQGGKCQNA